MTQQNQPGRHVPLFSSRRDFLRFMAASLALGKIAVALRLLGRAHVVHATPEIRLLARILARRIASGSEAQRAVHDGVIDDCAKKYPPPG